MANKAELPVSYLESQYGIVDIGLREYLSESTRKTNGALRHWRNEMAQSRHPVVRAAGGWAAAESGLYRPRPKERGASLDGRLAALGEAKTFWEDALQDMNRAPSTTSRRLELATLQISLRQALAYIPLMEVAASWIAGEPLPENEVRARRQETMRQTVDQAAMINRLSVTRQDEAGIKAVRAAEALCGLVGQGTIDSPMPYAVVPASIRYVRQPDRRLRANFMAVRNESPYRRTFIRARPYVQAEEQSRRSTAVVTFHADVDFSIGPTQSFYDTLDAFDAREAGVATPGIVVALDMMRNKMMERLDAHQVRFES